MVQIPPRKALALATQKNAVMVSFSPEQLMDTWYEKALIPYVYCRLASKFSFDDVNDPGNGAAAANGQFLLVCRDVYESVGGHASVAREVLEDVAFARRVKSAGHRIWFASGKGIVRVRMYRSFGAMWEGWKKNLFPLMGGSAETTGKEVLRAGLPVTLTLLAAIVAGVLAGSDRGGSGSAAVGVCCYFDRILSRIATQRFSRHAHLVRNSRKAAVCGSSAGFVPEPPAG